MGKIPVMEIFPAIQGEGMVAGKKTIFVRTANCDYSCDWCDSAFTWNSTEKDTITMYDGVELADELFRQFPLINDVHYAFEHVTISGGNPALIGKPMEEFIARLHAFGIKVALETQGSIWRDWFTSIDELTISPKPPSSLMKTNFVVLDKMISDLDQYGVNHSLKVVVFDEADYEYAVDIHKRYPYVPFYLSVGNTDSLEEGDISGRLLNKLEELWDMVMNDHRMNDVVTLPQLHTLVYGNKRKV